MFAVPLQLTVLLCIVLQTGAVIMFLGYLIYKFRKHQSVEPEQLTGIVVSNSSIAAHHGSPSPSEISEAEEEEEDEEEDNYPPNPCAEISTASFQICPRCFSHGTPAFISTTTDLRTHTPPQPSPPQTSLYTPMNGRQLTPFPKHWKELTFADLESISEHEYENCPPWLPRPGGYDTVF